ncbi:hypothetical protein VCR17J2_670015 [Vibrio coralliirubri]|nr:hypothetical protein VCR17J2_670015 [Vibrio coralliirubri]
MFRSIASYLEFNLYKLENYRFYDQLLAKYLVLTQSTKLAYYGQACHK